MTADRYYYGDGLAGDVRPEVCLACDAASYAVDWSGFCPGFCEAHFLLSEYLIGWEDLS